MALSQEAGGGGVLLLRGQPVSEPACYRNNYQTGTYTPARLCFKNIVTSEPLRTYYHGILIRLKPMDQHYPSYLPPGPLTTQLVRQTNHA